MRRAHQWPPTLLNRGSDARTSVRSRTNPSCLNRWALARETGVDHEPELGESNHPTDRGRPGGRDRTKDSRVFARRMPDLDSARLHRRADWDLGRQAVQTTRDLYSEDRSHELPDRL